MILEIVLKSAPEIRYLENYQGRKPKFAASIFNH
jgi:hypothetical protein